MNVKLLVFPLLLAGAFLIGCDDKTSPNADVNAADAKSAVDKAAADAKSATIKEAADAKAGGRQGRGQRPGCWRQGGLQTPRPLTPSRSGQGCRRR